jgi:hypothetical protein
MSAYLIGFFILKSDVRAEAAMWRVSFFTILITFVGSVVARAQTVAIQVADLQDRPVQGVILSVGGNGSTSSATDVAGKTQIIVPAGTQPGDAVVLILVRKPAPNLIFFSPWEGRATVPKPQGFIGVVLGARGDRAALTNPKVVSSITAAINAENHSPRLGSPSQAERYETLKVVARKAGFQAAELDSTIRTTMIDADDPTQRKRGATYVEDYPTSIKNPR